MAFQDLRAFLALLESEGELARIKTEVDWELELGAVSRRAMDIRGPALLFESIKGYGPAAGRVLANTFGRSRASSHGRFALAMGLPKETPLMDLIAEFALRSSRRIPPRIVQTGACKENILTGADVDVCRFPVPLIHGGDGGRYVGTWHVNVTKDPDSGLVNWGMYRHVVHGPNLLGWWVAPAQHAAAPFYQKHEPRGERMPIAIAIGVDEISIRYGHTYRIVVSDLERRRPIWFGGEDRPEAGMAQFYRWLADKKSARFALALMDIWKPFRNATQLRAPQAAILTAEV